MTRRALPPGVELRQYRRGDGSMTETYAVRYTDSERVRRRRTFDSVDDALDFLAKRRSAKRWRPDEIRQEQGGRQTLTEFFEEWWMTHAMVELKRSTLATYRCLWEVHAQPRLGSLQLREIDARKVVAFRAQLLTAGASFGSCVAAAGGSFRCSSSSGGSRRTRASRCRRDADLTPAPTC